MSEKLDPLLKDYQDQISALFAKVEPLIEEFRSVGMSGVFIMGSYDELTRFPHNQWRHFGNPLAVWGQVSQYVEAQKTTVHARFRLVDHNDDDDDK